MANVRPQPTKKPYQAPRIAEVRAQEVQARRKAAAR